MRRCDQPRCLGNVVDTRLGRIQQDAVEQIIHQLHGDLVQHDSAENLVDIEVGFEETCQSSIERASKKTANQRAGNDD